MCVCVDLRFCLKKKISSKGKTVHICIGSMRFTLFFSVSFFFFFSPFYFVLLSIVCLFIYWISSSHSFQFKIESVFGFRLKLKLEIVWLLFFFLFAKIALWIDTIVSECHLHTCLLFAIYKVFVFFIIRNYEYEKGVECAFRNL